MCMLHVLQVNNTSATSHRRLTPGEKAEGLHDIIKDVSYLVVSGVVQEPWILALESLATAAIVAYDLLMAVATAKDDLPAQ